MRFATLACRLALIANVVLALACDNRTGSLINQDIATGDPDATAPGDTDGSAEGGWEFPGPDAQTDGTGGEEVPVAAGCPAPGEVIISEIMADPLVSSDAQGEYFEVTNLTDRAFDVVDWELRSGTAKTYVTLPNPLVLAPHGVLVFAKSGDEALNGGFHADYVMIKLSFTNSADDVSIACNGTVIDRVAYVSSAGWPHKSGHAMVLDPSAFDAAKNDDPKNWCGGFEAFGAGDFGSPGAVNGSCGATSCGDKTVQAWEACDDGNSKAGDGCDPGCVLSPDKDGDHVPDLADNCPDDPNEDQADSDGDGFGDVCDPPSCGNKTVEGTEECDDGNKVAGDGCENDCRKSVDTDGDGVFDAVDNCPLDKNADQADDDLDGIGNVCDPPECGNGVQEAGEDCEDGNTDPGDGCTADCKVESFAEGCVIVTEIMYDPKAVSDTKGEWIEVYNTTDAPVDIAGWHLTDEAGDDVVLKPADGHLVVPPHDYLSLGSLDDPELNGGVDLDYAYGGSFSLASDADKVVLKWAGHLIDKVVYGSANGLTSPPGYSLNLGSDMLSHVFNDAPGSWCQAGEDALLPGGDHGTPGTENRTCPTH
jgi:cysteine-rich repeat protein